MTRVPKTPTATSGAPRTKTPIWEPRTEPDPSSWLFRRSTVVVMVVVGVIAAGFLLWPRVSLLFSPARPIVNALSQDALWVDPALGQGPVDGDRIRGIIGQRPLGIVVLAADNNSFDGPLDACTAVAGRIDDLTVMVIQDGELGAGCQGDNVPITGNEFGYDFVFWSMMDSQTAFLHGDLPAQVEQLALFYDTRVASGDLEARTRSFSAPDAQWALAVGLVLGVTAGVVLVLFGLRRGVVVAQRRQERRRRWRARREDLDAELQEIALIMLAADAPASTPSRPRIQAAAAVSGDYIQALDELSNAPTGSDLTDLRQRIRAIRSSLTQAAATGGRR